MVKRIKKGFTIVELVIVIAVIGILSAVLIPTFINFFDDSKTEMVQIYNRLNEQDIEIIVKDKDTKEIIYQGKSSEWDDKDQYELVDIEGQNILLVKERKYENDYIE